MNADDWGKRLRIAAEMLDKAVDHKAELAALLVYQNELVAGLCHIFGRHAAAVGPAKILMG